MNSENDKVFIKLIGNKYFTLSPIEAIIKEFLQKGKGGLDTSGKALFSYLLYHLGKVGYTEKEFVKALCDDLFIYENFENLRESIEKFINDNYFIINFTAD